MSGSNISSFPLKAIMNASSLTSELLTSGNAVLSICESYLPSTGEVVVKTEEREERGFGRFCLIIPLKL